jgi:hypothetical protein
MKTIRRLAVGAVGAAILAGCYETAPPADPYDHAKMDFRSTPAKITLAAPLNGALAEGAGFAEGASLSLTAELKPLDPSPVKNVRLDTTHKIIEIAPGVKFSAWTFLSRLRVLVAANVVDLAVRGIVTRAGVVVPVKLADLFRLADRVRAVAERLRGG